MTWSPATPLPPPDERRRLRETASLTRPQLAERVGVRPETVRAWESGRSAPRGRNREAYAKLLAGLAEGAAGAGTRESPSVRREKEATEVVTVRVDKPAGDGRSGEFAQAPPPSSVSSETPETSPGLTPAQAFDALYSFCAPALVRQTYLLTGRRTLARESVERAFQLAWDRWPEVARDPDPAGWVRAAAYEWALSPWHRYRRRHRQSEPPPPDEDDRALLEVLLHLPPPYRRTLLLYDGLGLGLPETAAETEASTRAAAGRLTHAREAVAARLPDLSDPRELHRRLAELASTGRLRAAEPPVVRDASERRARIWTRAAVAFTVVLIGTTALTLRTAPTRYEPPVPPGGTVRGVPPRVAPGPLSEDQRELRARLREELPRGPERLAPQAR
ncbi:sigma factor-like helix-turn-helix DNA-binding protein [Streptomyces sp. NPDC020731]|uniref:sigma factor-like helix-turn-helix DNA-binding protein n=1 Tax=Streptomyces sp. NPDC020731 TaxID=3365085 RepID=UPI0037A0D5B9